MPAEADLLCDYYISSNLKSTKRSNSSITPSNLLKLNSQLSDSMSSLSSTTSSLTETIDFVKYEKNPMEFLKAKYPVLNGLNKKEIDYQKTESSNTRMTNQANKILEIQSNIENNWSKIKKNGVGLLNLGNNCYLNATLQCLAYTPPLSQWLITRTHSSSCRFKQLKGFCSLCEVEKITFDIFNSFNGCAKPNALCFNIKKISNVFGVGRQEDASEFFTTLLESMNKTINFISNPNNNNKQQNGINNKNFRNGTKQRSILDEIFSFQFRSRVTCCNCGRLSDTIENTNTWPVDVKYVKDLQKGMLHFLREEVLDGENSYKCDKCNKKTRATKKYSIRTAPNNLVIHLKRFDFSHAGKLSHFVSYPETLSLKTVVPDSTSSNENKILRNTAYKLYGVLVHLGHTSRSGHYYSYIRGPNNNWVKADDSRISAVQEKEALGQNAYILFYNKTNNNKSIIETIQSQSNQHKTFATDGNGKIEEKFIITANSLINKISQPKELVLSKTVNTVTPTLKVENTNGHVNGFKKEHTENVCNKNTEQNIEDNKLPVNKAKEHIDENGNQHKDINMKISRKERIISKLIKKLKKKEIKRLRKKITKLLNKKSEFSNSDDNINNPKKIFLNKKRELRLIKKIISKRKSKLLSTQNQESEKKVNHITQQTENVITNGVNLNGTKTKIEQEIKIFNSTLLTNGSKIKLVTWNNEESSLLSKDKNDLNNFSEEEKDDYNNEFDKPKIREKILKKNSFHNVMHSNMPWKTNHYLNGKKTNYQFNNPNRSYNYNKNVNKR